jgi:methionyl-tRNA synthetase
MQPTTIWTSWMSLIIILVIWSSIWKAIALWKSAKNDSKSWFVILFLVNTVGILEILYIYVFGRIKETKEVNNK